MINNLPMVMEMVGSKLGLEILTVILRQSLLDHGMLQGRILPGIMYMHSLS